MTAAAVRSMALHRLPAPTPAAAAMAPAGSSLACPSTRRLPSFRGLRMSTRFARVSHPKAQKVVSKASRRQNVLCEAPDMTVQRNSFCSLSSWILVRSRFVHRSACFCWLFVVLKELDLLLPHDLLIKWVDWSLVYTTGGQRW